MAVLLIKLVGPPLLIALVALASSRWGRTHGGLIAGLPIISGPVSVFFALERGRVFAREGAIGSIEGAAAAGAFCLGYAITSSRRCSWPRSLVAALGAFGAVVVVFHLLHPQLGVALALSTGWLLLVILVCERTSHALVPHVSRITVARATAPTIGSLSARGEVWRPIVFRMSIGAIVVVVLTSAAHALGAQLAGLLSPLPVVSGITIISEHRAHGAWAASATLAGTAVATLGFIAFFLTVALLSTVSPLWLLYFVAALVALIGTSVARLLVGSLERTRARRLAGVIPAIAD